MGIVGKLRALVALTTLLIIGLVPPAQAQSKKDTAVIGMTLEPTGLDPTAGATHRNKLMADAQRLVADDAVAAYLYQPTWITVGKAGLKGLWKDAPILANDLSTLSWQ